MADLQAVVSDWYVLLLIAGAHHGLAQRQTMTVDNSYSMQGTVCGDEVFNEQRSKICWYLQAKKKWKHTNTPPPKKKKFEAIVPADKVMASVFCNRCGIIHVDFLHRHVTINSDYYCHVLSDVQTRLSVEK